MTAQPPIPIPVKHLPRYLCPHCDQLLTYAETDLATHETPAICGGCGRKWIITATAYPANIDSGKHGGMTFTMRSDA